ncbi:MAG TPA: hypothetical protein VEA92_01640 [Candidatus Paceibacterota bacterium]|nr:hypothetical protein [Candidatus Paceibacterota bacterium]
MNGEQAADAAERTYPYFSEVLQEEIGSDRFLTPYPIALEEIHRRSGDTALKRRVEQYLNYDIPEYMQGDPVLYLARHVATPNFETLRFLHLLEPLGLPIVISQDTKDTFTSTNMLKRFLGKMPVLTRITQKDGATHELYRNTTIIDFAQAQGRPFSEVKTLWGESLIDFHTRLFSEMKNGRACIVDDAAWIDRNERGNLLEHYKRFLALFVAHGVLFEDYLIEDKEEEHFMREVLEPAFAFVEETFGVRPLITQLTPSSVESVKFWLSYPKDVLPLLKH